MEKRNWMRSFHSWLVVVLVPIFYFLFSACLHAQNAKKEKVDMLVAGGTVVTMNAERRIIEDGAVAVNGDAIVAVGSRRTWSRSMWPRRASMPAGNSFSLVSSTGTRMCR